MSNVNEMEVEETGLPVFRVRSYQETYNEPYVSRVQNGALVQPWPGLGARGQPSHPIYPELPQQPGVNIDWTYVMRRSMQEIIPGLFLGPFAAATKAALNDMVQAGLTHVICIRHPSESHIVKPNHLDRFIYLTLEFADSGLEGIIGHLKASIEFINGCRNGGGRCLVHGNGGISRSGAIVIGYVMATYGVTLKEAFNHTQEIRFCVNPNDGFMNQLREFEPIYRATHSVPRQLPQMDKNPLKRSVNENSDDEDEYGNVGTARNSQSSQGSD